MNFPAACLNLTMMINSSESHSLQEIRVRALDNILLKLEHKLICEEDLIQERHLLVRLVEWFNFPSSPKQEQALGLLVKLSKHTPAAEILYEIGCIEFVSQLRPDLPSALHPLIDQLLENILHLPNVPSNRPTDLECRYNGKGDVTPKSDILQFSTSYLTADSSYVSDTMVPASYKKAPLSEAGRRVVLDYDTVSRMVDYQSPQVGYFTSGANESSTSHIPQEDSSIGISSCFRMTTFPWLPLTATDRHVLLSTNLSLQSRDESLLISACEFLSDVVLHDFPAEIFLQRPSITKSLLSLLAIPLDDKNLIQTQTARTLTDLSLCLISRLKYNQDPALYTPKQEFGSSSPVSFHSTLSDLTSSQSVQSLEDRRPSAIGQSDTRHRGDGRDGDASASSSRSSPLGSGQIMAGDKTDRDEMHSLQFSQMTMPQFCVSLLEKSLSLLQTTHEELTVSALHLINAAFIILRETVLVNVWDDNSASAREVVEKLVEILELMAELLHYHHHGNADHRGAAGSQDGRQHRLTFIGVTNMLVQFLRLLVPTDKAKFVLPDNLVPALALVVFDESLAFAYPDVRHSVIGYFQIMDPIQFNVYCSTARICTSMEKTCKFLMAFDDKVSDNGEELVKYAEIMLPSLPYHKHLPCVYQYVKLCSAICRNSPSDPSLMIRARDVLMKLLADPLDDVREKAYGTCLEIVQESLSISNAADPRSTSYKSMQFLCDSKTLYQIVCFGLADTSKKISDLASKLVLALLQAQMLMHEAVWEEFLTSLVPSLSILQSYADLHSPLGSAILDLIETESLLATPGSLPLLEKFRGTLRLMMSSDVQIRSEALKRLAWFLSAEENSHNKLPVFSNLDVSNLANVLVMNVTRVLEDEDMGRSVFQVDGMKKVYEIFTSSTVESAVKKSAAEQLAIMLQDSYLHPAFLNEGGVDTIIEHLKRGILKPSADQLDCAAYLPACVTILRYILQHDPSTRHRLAHEAEVYYAIFRVALLYLHDNRTCYEVSHMLTLLLFDELSWIKQSDIVKKSVCRFSLPAVITKRYRLPFRSHTHHDISPHQVALPAEHDPLLSGSPAEMLRIVWNMAWHGGMDSLLSQLKQQTRVKELSEYCSHLTLTPDDLQVLQITPLTAGLQQCIHDVSNATSHVAVSDSLRRLNIYLLIGKENQAVDRMLKLEWKSVIGRFLKTVPSSAADEALLREVLHFISTIFALSNQIPDDILIWLGEALYYPKGPLIGLLTRSMGDAGVNLATVRRSLDKELLLFISSFISHQSNVLHRSVALQPLRGDVVQQLLLRLNVSDAPHFYNLASLESTLQALMHITASPSWSEECTIMDSAPLCSHVLTGLLEVVSAFHIGRGGTSLSFMGKDVTKAATICLRHLSYEMATLSTDKNWPKQWLYSKQEESTFGEPGLNWLLTLWAYRDSEVRAAGLGIAVTLTSKESGRIMVTSNCKHIPGGIWGAAFSILLDQSECSFVRQQAALVLVNLTSQPMPSGSPDGGQMVWQGPVVTDTEHEVSLVGLPALLALLHHSQFYTEMLMLFSNFYPQPGVHPVSIAEGNIGISPAISESTITTIADATLVNRSALSGISGQHRQEVTADIRNTELMTSTPNDGKTIQGQTTEPGELREPYFSRRVTQYPSSSANRLHTYSPATVSSVTSTPRLHTYSPATVSSVTSTPGSSSTTHLGDQSTNSTLGSGDSVNYQSISSPCLVSSVCRLIRNLIILAPEDNFVSIKKDSILVSLLSLIDLNLMEAYCCNIPEQTGSTPYELVFCDLCQMYAVILDLVRTSVLHDTETRISLASDTKSLAMITGLLGVHVRRSPSSSLSCRSMYSSVFSLLTVLLQLQKSAAIQSITTVFAQQWSVITDCILTILKTQSSKVSFSLYVKCLQFLSILLTEEARLQSGPDAIDGDTIAGLLETMNATGVAPSQDLCSLLITAYDKVVLKSADEKPAPEKPSVISALKALLAVCNSAKATALELGFVESLVEYIKHLHVRLSVDLLPSANKVSSRKRDESVLQEVILTFDLLRNFMHRNLEVKTAGHQSGLGQVVHKLWAWCLSDADMMMSTLQLLTVFTARCPEAMTSLAFTSSSSVTSATKGQLSGNSFVHCVLKVASKDVSRENLSLLKVVYGLLTNLALSPECRNILWKSNFITDVCLKIPEKMKRGKLKKAMEDVCLCLLVTLSFSTEGQQIILKPTDSVDILLDLLDVSHGQETALLIIRNLCCHANNKAKLLANEKLIPYLLQAIEFGSEKQQCIAASGLWALVYNHQKAKMILKNANILRKLEETLIKVSRGNPSEMSAKSMANMKSVISAVRD